MTAIPEGLFERSPHGTKYARRRIPAAIRAAYPSGTTHILRNLNTSDPKEAKLRLRAELVRIDAEFEQKRKELAEQKAKVAVRRIRDLTDGQLGVIASYWVRSILLSDEWNREQGLDDIEFAELGDQLKEQRNEFGRMLAQGQTAKIFPALHSFLYMCGLDLDQSPEEAKRATYAFMRAVVTAIDHQLARQSGGIVNTDDIAPERPHPRALFDAPSAASGSPSWDQVFAVWRDYVPNRPKTTTIASTTPWRDLIRFAGSEHGVFAPAAVTPTLMTKFVENMRERDRPLSVKTINERIGKIRAIYRIAVGKHELAENPAANTLGYKESSFEKRRKRRLPFSNEDLMLLFGSEVFTKHTRSKGQAAEASYWIPLIMYYSGARPEEVGGLALQDVCDDPVLGRYFSIVDRPSPAEDKELFDSVPRSHCRTLKNATSIRRVPIAKELIDLGLLRYVEWLRAKGETMLFPVLKKDWHEKLTGAFGKFFGRYLRMLGITDKRKVLYSMRHNMKDLLEVARVPTKYLQRTLGHTSGDGEVTDGYGSELPFIELTEYFNQVRFPPLPATPWQPGKGFVRLKSIGGGTAKE